MSLIDKNEVRVGVRVRARDLGLKAWDRFSDLRSHGVM